MSRLVFLNLSIFSASFKDREQCSSLKYYFEVMELVITESINSELQPHSSILGSPFPATHIHRYTQDKSVYQKAHLRRTLVD